MEFVNDKTEFPSMVHRQIYFQALRLTPVEVSLKEVPAEWEALTGSCRDYAAYVRTLLGDMYQEPDSYGMRPGAMEQFLDGKKINRFQRICPAKVDALRSELHDSVYQYFRYLLALGTAGEVEGQRLVIPAAEYKKIRLRFDKSCNPKRKIADNRIPYQTRLAALERTGLFIIEQEGAAIVSSKSYPAMLPAMQALAKSAGNVKTFGKQGFYNCEFRQLFHRYTPQYEDVMRPLPKPLRETADNFYDLAMEWKLRPSCTTFWKVNFTWKSTFVVQMSTDGNHLIIRVCGAYRWEDQPFFNRLLAEKSVELQKYAVRHLNYCTGCASKHLGMFTEVLGKRKRVCGGGEIGFRVTDPTPEEFLYFKELIQMRQNFISAQNEAKREMEA